MSYYCAATDLQRTRSDIVDAGVDSLDDYIDDAEAQINDRLDTAWYRGAARERGIDYVETRFDPDLVTVTSQIKAVAVYLTLALVYESVSRSDDETDPFAQLGRRYRNLYMVEIEALLQAGIDYDYEDDDDPEHDTAMPRVLKRM